MISVRSWQWSSTIAWRNSIIEDCWDEFEASIAKVTGKAYSSVHSGSKRMRSLDKDEPPFFVAQRIVAAWTATLRTSGSESWSISKTVIMIFLFKLWVSVSSASETSTEQHVSSASAALYLDLQEPFGSFKLPTTFSRILVRLLIWLLSPPSLCSIAMAVAIISMALLDKTFPPSVSR